MIKLKENTVIINKGSDNNTFFVCLEGKVAAYLDDEYVTLDKGDVIGIFDISAPHHILTYVSLTPVTLIQYKYDTSHGLWELLETQKDLRKLILTSVSRHMPQVIKIFNDLYSHFEVLRMFLTNSLKRYESISKSIGNTPKKFPMFDEVNETLDNCLDEIPDWLLSYYSDIAIITSKVSFTPSIGLIQGHLYHSVTYISSIQKELDTIKDAMNQFGYFMLNKDSNDFLNLYMDLYKKAIAANQDASKIRRSIDAIIYQSRLFFKTDSLLIEKRLSELDDIGNSNTNSNSDFLEELAFSTDAILSYGECKQELISAFKANLDFYKNCSDKYSSDKETDACRRSLTKEFYEIYEKVLFQALKQETVPVIIKMFLNFGFVDMELAGKDNSVELYKIAENFKGDSDQQIYTVFEWFRAIYNGTKQPSRNEFDIDYVQNLRQKVREGRINKKEEAVLTEDVTQKVLFELTNMFTTVNRITSGRMFAYCPLLTEENILRNPFQMLMDTQKIKDTIAEINSKDYTIFYHESLFQDDETGVKETVRVDILPDIILMPNVGNRGIMWQEIEGNNRKSPSRMILPILFQDNTEKVFVRMFGEYRWEMCKREMGGRWNDIQSHCLTSDYCDYAQFYQKNHDLSYDAKEKIKATLKKCRNSYKELFINDYTLFITLEATGAPRLNKVSRGIIFKYCPLSREYREKIAGNSMFSEPLSKFKINTSQAVHRLEQIKNKYAQSGKELPEALKNQSEMILK